MKNDKTRLTMAALFLLLCSCQTLFSQQKEAAQAMNMSISSYSNVGDFQPGRPLYSVSNYEGLKGSPLWDDLWRTGTLYVDNPPKAVEGMLLFKFNAYENEIWFRTPDGKEAVLLAKRLAWLELPDSTGAKQVLKFFTPGDETGRKIGLYLYDSERYHLVKYIRKTFIRADFQERGLVQTGKPYDRFEDTSEYWARKAGQPFQKVKLTKKSLLELEPGLDKEKIERFCKKKRIKNNLDEADAAALLQFMELGQ